MSCRKSLIVLKARTFALFVAALVVVSAGPTLAVANENECAYIGKDEVSFYASAMLSVLSEDQEYSSKYGMEAVSFDELAIGDPIKCYDIADGNAEYANVDVWPILYGSDIVASIWSINNGDDTTSFIFRTGVAEELDSAYDQGEACAVVCDVEAGMSEVLTQEESSIFTANEGLGSDGALEYFSQDNFVTLDITDEPTEGAALYGPPVSNCSLTVPVKQQENNTCWAASVSSIGEYMTGMDISFRTICKTLGVSEAAGGTNADAIKALQLFKYSDSTPVSAGSYSVPSDPYIYNWLWSGIPIYAGLVKPSGGMGHTVVVCECNKTTSGVFTVTVMNPGTADFEMMSKNASGVLTLNYNNDKYGWSGSSILLTGWQKPAGGNKWSHFTDGTGLADTGWKKISGKWYHFDEVGYAAQSEWQSIDGYWYAFDSSCAMRTGWFKEGGNWYYLRPAANTPGTGPQGSMLANGTWTINGKSYTFNASGVCLNP